MSFLNGVKLSNPYNLPSPYDKVENGYAQYLHDVVDIIARFDWIYNFKVVDFFSLKVWEKMPEDVSMSCLKCLILNPIFIIVKNNKVIVR